VSTNDISITAGNLMEHNLGCVVIFRKHPYPLKSDWKLDGDLIGKKLLIQYIDLAKPSLNVQP